MRRKTVSWIAGAMACAGPVAAPAFAQAGAGQGMPAAPPPTGTIVYIGSQGKAIHLARLDPATGRLALLGAAATVERPTWLAIDPTRAVLYSVSEIGNRPGERGAVHGFAIDPATGALKPLGRADSGGGGPTFLSYDARAGTVFVANFASGDVAAIPVRADGSLAPSPGSVVHDDGTGPGALQRGPHAHGATMDPSGRFVLTPDLGADRIFIRRFDKATGRLTPAAVPFEQLPPGTGPRHLVFSPDGRFLFLLAELTAEVRSFRWDAKAGRLHPIQAVALDGPDFTGQRSAAEINVSRDGRFVYATSRGRNMLVAFAVDRAGGLRKLQEVPTGGDSPRSFQIDPSGRWMILTNQNSDTLAIFAVDQATGLVSSAGPPIPFAGKPDAIAFYP